MKKTPKPRDTVQRLKETIHKQPAVFAVYLALRLIVLAELVMSIIRGEYESAFICLLVLALAIGAVTRQDLQTLPKGEKLADRLHLR